MAIMNVSKRVHFAGFVASCLTSIIWFALAAQASSPQDKIWQRYMDSAQIELKAGKNASAQKNLRAALSRAKKEPSLEIRTALELASLEFNDGHFKVAEPTLKTALNDIRRLEKSKASTEHNDLDESFHRASEMLADCYRADGQYKLAEQTYRSILKESSVDTQKCRIASAVAKSELADVLSIQRHYGEAEPLYKEAMTVFEQYSSNDHLLDLLQDYEALLNVTNRLPEAQKLQTRIEAMRLP